MLQALSSEAVRTRGSTILHDGVLEQVHGWQPVPDRGAAAKHDHRIAGEAVVFLHRPRDVEWMVRHWQQTGRIGLLSEVIAANICQKLAEPRYSVRPCHAELAVDRLIAGARSLAAAVTFTRKPALRLPNDGPRADMAPDALDTAEVLTGWTDGERQELLSRALFDEAKRQPASEFRGNFARNPFSDPSSPSERECARYSRIFYSFPLS
ncbi:hypothetical protein [Azospirillum argentinense]|uniref:hypothetical protein n=1 Tax=Azospirillum argentinense TaxID=2970906 RepID=UPI0010BF6A2D|nr:hypothetical protein [Azospirillum argentinense]